MAEGARRTTQLRLAALEGFYEENPQGVCLRIANGPDAPVGGYEEVTYAQLCERAARLVRSAGRAGIHRGSCCLADMSNCASFLYLLLASALGGFSVFSLNTRLDASQKALRIQEACKAMGVDELPLYDEATVLEAIQIDRDFDFVERMNPLTYIRLGVDNMDPDAEALIFAAPTPSGRLKIVPLTWGNLATSAAAIVEGESLRKAQGLSQIVLPLYRADGMQAALSSLLIGRPFILYRYFDANQVLRDAKLFGATHISVSWKMLDDMLSADDREVMRQQFEFAQTPHEEAEVLKLEHPMEQYQCIIFNEAVLELESVRRIEAAKARVFACFSMAEAAGCMASILVQDGYDGSLAPLPGYELAIIAPDQHGYGELAIKGPGVMRDYLNMRAALTADRYLLTGDIACIREGKVCVLSKNQGMFVTDDEAVYPEEIRNKLMQIPGVTDAYVFGDEDGKWGFRPAAIVEAAGAADQDENFNLQLMADEIRLNLINRLSPVQCPNLLIVVPGFPRNEQGVTDIDSLRLLYSQRIDVRKVEVWQAKLPLHRGMRIGSVKYDERSSLIVRVTDWAGRTGVGEVAALDFESYLPETLAQDRAVLVETLAPLVREHLFVHPSQVSALFRSNAKALARPMACAAVESALWDLYGKVVHRSLVQLIGGRECVSEAGSIDKVPPGCIPGSIAIGMGNASETLAKVRSAVLLGCSSVKLSIRPGFDVDIVRAVREEFPQLKIVLDAQQSYTEADFDTLRELDSLGAACIEEPLDPAFKPKVGPQGFWDRLVRLQRDMSTPICLDESWATLEQLEEILDEHPTLRCVCIKLGKTGGVQPALEFFWWARDRGISLRMGDLYESGVARRLHAAFATLPGMNLPSDIYDTRRYMERDISVPPFALEDGLLRVNPESHAYGLGCDIDTETLAAVCQNKWQLD